MKAVKLEIPVVDFKLWCERCCIRIAPQEERTVMNGKTYHPQCYAKVVVVPLTSKAKS